MIKVISRTDLPPKQYPLEAWRSQFREPVLFSDDPHEWRFIEAMWLQEPLVFRYWGGSTPGALRRIVPRRLFRAAGFRPLYFTGWCPLRQEERVFRADRAHLEPARNGCGDPNAAIDAGTVSQSCHAPFYPTRTANRDEP